MLSQKMLAKMNEQIAIEHDSANLYLQMSAWCEWKGLPGFAAFLRAHSREEMIHMYKLFDYVNETGALAKVGPLQTPDSDFASILDVFKLTLEHEQYVTGKINDLTDVALSEKDFSTFNFLQWYVGEQHEEEALFKSIIDKLELVGTEGKGIFLLDREMSTMHAAPAGGAGPAE